MKFSFTKKNILIISIIIIIIVLAITLPLVLIKKSSSESSSELQPYTKINNIKYKYTNNGVAALNLSWNPPSNVSESPITEYVIKYTVGDYIYNTDILDIKNEITTNNTNIDNIPLMIGLGYNISISGNNPKNYDYSKTFYIQAYVVGKWYDNNDNIVNIDTTIGIDAREQNLSIKELANRAWSYVWSYVDSPIYTLDMLSYVKIGGKTIDSPYTASFIKTITNPPIYLGKYYKINQIVDSTTYDVLYTYKLKESNFIAIPE